MNYDKVNSRSYSSLGEAELGKNSEQNIFMGQIKRGNREGKGERTACKNS